MAILKWHLYGIDNGEEYLERVKMFQQRYIERDMPPEVKRNFEDLQNYKVPRASNCKAQITGWMMYWPLYLVDTILLEFLWKVFKRIYQLLLPIFDRITNYNTMRVQREIDSLAVKAAEPTKRI